MHQYLDLLRDILKNGALKEQRAVLQSTQARPRALSVFGRLIRFDLREGFPLLTTKRVPFVAV